LRRFAVDAIHDALLRDAPAKEISKTELDEHLASGYGIFAGRNVQWATLKFTPQSARWVSAQIWRPKQRARVERHLRPGDPKPPGRRVSVLGDVVRLQATWGLTS
jgi:hypothetical protein